MVYAIGRSQFIRIVCQVGSLHVLPWLPFIEWYNFLPMQSRDWLQVVDSVACFGAPAASVSLLFVPWH